MCIRDREELREKFASLDASDPLREVLPGPDEYQKRVKPGDWVEENQVLAVLEDPMVEERLRDSLSSVEIYASEVQNYEAIRALSPEFAAEAQLAQANREAAEESYRALLTQLKRRVLRARKSGYVVAPQSRPEKGFDAADPFALGQWHGTPLDDRNANAVLAATDHFCSIAPDKDYEVFLYMDQSDLVDVKLDAPVQLKLEHLPSITYKGKVQQISKQGEFFAPPPLTNKYGGALTTVTDGEGRERLTSTAYRVIARLNNDTELLRPGMRGKGRFLVDQRTAWEWGKRYFYETFRFRL